MKIARGIYPWHSRLLLLPGLAGFSLFYIVPLIGTMYYAMIESNFDPVFVGFKHYQAVITNPFYRLALGNTLLYCAVLVASGCFFALIVAFLMRKVPYIRWLQVVFLMPVFLPSTSVTAVWRLAFAMQADMEPVALMLLAFWKNAGVALLVILSALVNMDKEVEWAASVDGANEIQKARYIWLPALQPALLATAAYLIMGGFRLFREAYLLYGAHPVRSVYQVQHYMNNHFAKLNYQNLSAGAMIFALLTIAIIIPSLWWLNRKQRDDG